METHQSTSNEFGEFWDQGEFGVSVKFIRLFALFSVS